MNYIKNLICFIVLVLDHEATPASASLHGPWAEIGRNRAEGHIGTVVDIVDDHDGSDLLIVKIQEGAHDRYVRLARDEVKPLYLPE